MAHTLRLAGASRLLLLVLFSTVPAVTLAQTHQPVASHSDPVTAVVLALAVILAAAKLAGPLAVQLGQPAVLGELVAGVVLGSLDLAGIGWFGGIENDQTVDIVARLGVVILLFEGVGAWLLPNRSVYVHAFLGATLTATSVGITARVLQDLGRSKSPEARVILGAAVIGEVLGLVILAVVGGVIAAAIAATRCLRQKSRWCSAKPLDSCSALSRSGCT